MNKQNRWLVITGGSVDMDTASCYLQGKEWAGYWTRRIAVDSGLDVFYELGVVPDYALGDFDSVSAQALDWYRGKEYAPFEAHPPEKDDTDTQLALKMAVRHQADEVLLLGATGTRLDHTLANIQLLTGMAQAGIRCRIQDAHNRITLLDSDAELCRRDCFGSYISFLPLTPEVTGVTLEGFKYNVQEETFRMGSSRGVSNELASDTARIQIGSGMLLMIESKD